MKGGIKYEGDFKDGKMEGQGVLTIKGKGTYKGEFKDGKKHGHGVYTQNDGQKLEGEGENDELKK